MVRTTILFYCSKLYFFYLKNILSAKINIINFSYLGFSNGNCKPLYCQGHQVGLVRKDVEDAIAPFKDTFVITEKQIDIVCDSENTPQSNSSNDTFDQISANYNNVLQQLRDSPKHDFIALKGWRNECYNIRPSFSSPPLFKMERSATCKYLIILCKVIK